MRVYCLVLLSLHFLVRLFRHETALELLAVRRRFVLLKTP